MGRRGPITGGTAHPSWRGWALGVYRLWRDAGYAIGPLLGTVAAFWSDALLLGVSALILPLLLRETDPNRRVTGPAWPEHPEWVD